MVMKFKSELSRKSMNLLKMQLVTRKNACLVFHPFHRIKIMQNIGISFVKMAQFNDAITSFEHIMAEKASFHTGEL